MSECRRPIPDEERESWQTFGGLLAETRRRAGVSQRQLALVAGFGLRHMQNIEAGERRTYPSRLIRMAEYLAIFYDTDLRDPRDEVDDVDDRTDRLIYALLEVSGVTLPPESEFEDRPEVQRRQRARARRAWFEMTGPDRRKIRQRRASGEEQRRRARVALRMAHENAGFDPWEVRLPGL